MSDSITTKRRKSLFRPCIDLHKGVVKQIVGGSLRDDIEGEEQKQRALTASGFSNLSLTTTSTLKTNFTSTLSAEHYAKLYKKHRLVGVHMIKLGPGNDEVAKKALLAWPDEIQIGGGITLENAKDWIKNGASKVIVTSYLFPNYQFSKERLISLCASIGKKRLVVDVSCRRKGRKWIVAMNRWQDLTDMEVNKESLDMLSKYCCEFLIHAADVEGLCQGIDEELVVRLGEWVTIPTTYAGGARDLQDLELVDELSKGKVDLTFGSALDIFGGQGVSLDELKEWNYHNTPSSLLRKAFELLLYATGLDEMYRGW